MWESPRGNKLSFLNCCLFYMYNSYSHLFQCLSGMSLWISIKMFFSKVLLNRRVFRIFMFHVIVLLMTSLSTIWHEGNIQRKLIAHQRYVRASCLPFPGTWLLKTLAHAKHSRAAAAATYSCYKNNIGSFVQTRERWFVLLPFRLDCSFSAAIS